MERTILLRVGVLSLLMLFAAFVYLPIGNEGFGDAGVFNGIGTGKCEDGKLCVVFFDVGQGDATYIESPSGMQVLIDGGRGSDVLRKLSQEIGFFDREINVVVATHPDADHIAGLIDVLDRYAVATILRTENESDTSVAGAFDMAVVNEGVEVVFARRGQTIDLGGGAVLEILFPDRDPTNLESNISSIVMRLTYGETEFLLTGDSPKSIEEYLVLTEGEHLESDVLKVGHHGSRTSTSELFLNEVNPQFAVISAGKDNRYEHPHVEVTDMLFNHGIETKNTAEVGSVVIVSDGVQLQLK